MDGEPQAEQLTSMAVDAVWTLTGIVCVAAIATDVITGTLWGSLWFLGLIPPRT